MAPAPYRGARTIRRPGLHSPAVRLEVLGSNGTYPTPGHPASGYVVDTASTSILLDLGPGTFVASLDADVAPAAVVITHVHPDHCADLFPLFSWLRFGHPERWGLPVVVPEGLVGRVAAFLGADDSHDLHRVFAFDQVGSGDERRFGDLVLRFGAATHPVPALVVAVGDGSATLVYSGDTGPGGDLPALAAGCDLLLCEATLQGEPGPDRYPYHLAAVEAGRIARDAGAGRLVVTHVAPSLDPQVSVAEATAVFEGPVDHAAPGMEVEL
jgi:ribonuclease BN (tRNA processing enzyme)